MIITEDIDRRISQIACGLLMREEPVRNEIYDAVTNAINIFLLHNRNIASVQIHKEAIVREIETRFTVYTPQVSILDDSRDHLEWFSSQRGEIEWPFWERYKKYLQESSRLPFQAIRRLDEVTNEILSRLESPIRPRAWDRRGLVVGQVQSGKTSNYTSLICKAADAGYRLIVVLAGIHNSLRSQTQQRLDEGFLGYDTQKRQLSKSIDIRTEVSHSHEIRIGVGLSKEPLHIVHSLTTSAENGDFNLTVARQANFMISGKEPILLVIKKNASVLRNLLNWSTDLAQQNMVKGIPLLLIDDEADNASINTRLPSDKREKLDQDGDPSMINGLIRQLLSSFEQSAYIGYTATPFANIFISDRANSTKYGEDLFPRSFIINLQAPSNYLGPARLFGLSQDIVTGQDDSVSGLPLIRHVYDYDKWVPDKHKKDYQPGLLVRTVKQAIKAFILTCATRRVRGQINVHNSMLIHVTRYIAVQGIITRQVSDELDFIQQRLRYSDGNASQNVFDEFKELWDADFKPTMMQFDEPDLAPVTWEQVKAELYAAAAKIEIRKINGTARDTLQYIEHKDGLNVICIGGDKLSRGLTLEGLSVSYYLRASTMYDTLMQMGRWFGYRVGYTDLCRLYTTSILSEWYSYIASADEELRAMFEEMVQQDKTPEDYGLGVRKHPDGLVITAATKMRNAQTVLITYEKRISETVVFFNAEKENEQNLTTTKWLVKQINSKSRYEVIKGNYVWNNIDGQIILDFLQTYLTHQAARTVRSGALRNYIKARMQEDELTEWTIAIISNQRNTEQHCSIDGITINFTERRPLSEEETGPTYSIRRLVSPADESIDLSQIEEERAREETRRIWNSQREKSRRKVEPDLPSGPVIRQIRPSKRGLLLIYMLRYDGPKSWPDQLPVTSFAISFPKSLSGSDTAVEYLVNDIYYQQLLDGNV